VRDGALTCLLFGCNGKMCQALHQTSLEHKCEPANDERAQKGVEMAEVIGYPRAWGMRAHSKQGNTEAQV
jgi:hypothetical protein